MEMVMKFPNGETPNLFIEVFNYTAALRFTDMLHLWIWRTETRTRGAARRLLLESRVLLFETLLTETLPKSDLGWTRLCLRNRDVPSYLQNRMKQSSIHKEFNRMLEQNTLSLLSRVTVLWKAELEVCLEIRQQLLSEERR